MCDALNAMRPRRIERATDGGAVPEQLKPVLNASLWLELADARAGYDRS